MLNHKFHVHRGDVIGSVFGFKVAQFFKGCTRPVWNCYIKSFFTGALPHYHLQTPQQIAAALYLLASSSEDTIVVQFDFSAYYDQFALRNKVPAAYCFLGRNGETFALSRMPMGFTLACAIAQATTWQLLNFEKQSHVITCIDNVAFAGTPAQVHHDATTFLRRCVAVGATLNELSQPEIADLLALPPEEQLAAVRAMHKDTFSFLGIEYTWSSRSKTLAPKTREKLVATESCLASIGGTIYPRQLATVVGILRYASFTLRLDSLERYETLDWLRGVAAYLQSDASLWDTCAIRLPSVHRTALLSWLQEVLAPRSLPIHNPLPATAPLTLIVDASGSGWGGILYDGASFSTFFGKWESEIASSVTTEPKAVEVFASIVLSTENPPIDVLVVTDHLPLVHAAASTAPRGSTYNALLLLLNRRFPSTRFIFAHIPGDVNPADSLSRTGSAPGLDLDSVRNAAGMGWEFALSFIHLPKQCALCDREVPWQC